MVQKKMRVKAGYVCAYARDLLHMQSLCMRRICHTRACLCVSASRPEACAGVCVYVCVCVCACGGGARPHTYPVCCGQLGCVGARGQGDVQHGRHEERLRAVVQPEPRRFGYGPVPGRDGRGCILHCRNSRRTQRVVPVSVPVVGRVCARVRPWVHIAPCTTLTLIQKRELPPICSQYALPSGPR